MSRVLPSLPLLILTALLFAQQPTFSPTLGTPSFSFEKAMLPSLADVNAGKFKKPIQGNRFQLTNVDTSFDRNFVLIHDEKTDRYTIQDKRGNNLFEGRLDGIPRFAASLDLGRNRQHSVILDIAAFGNHGNGTEIYQAFVPGANSLAPLQNPIRIEFMNGQENRAGTLTWYEDNRVYVVFDGEEAKVENTVRGIEVGAVTSQPKVLEERLSQRHNPASDEPRGT